MFFDDDLPVWGFIGKTEQAVAKGGQSETRFFLFTHFHFDVSYNGDRVIELNVSTVSVDPKKTLDITGATEGLNVSYSYSVKWRPTDVEFSDRMDRYSRYSFLPQHLEVWACCAVLCCAVCVCARLLLCVPRVVCCVSRAARSPRPLPHARTTHTSSPPPSRTKTHTGVRSSTAA